MAQHTDDIFSLAASIEGSDGEACLRELLRRFRAGPLGFTVLLDELPDLTVGARGDLVFLCCTISYFRGDHGYGMLNVANSTSQVHIRNALFLLPSTKRKRVQMNAWWRGKYALVALRAAEIAKAAEEGRAPSCSALHLCASHPAQFTPVAISQAMPLSTSPSLRWSVKSRVVHVTLPPVGDDFPLTETWRRRERWLCLDFESETVRGTGGRPPQGEEHEHVPADEGRTSRTQRRARARARHMAEELQLFAHQQHATYQALHFGFAMPQGTAGSMLGPTRSEPQEDSFCVPGLPRQVPRFGTTAGVDCPRMSARGDFGQEFSFLTAQGCQATIVCGLPR